MDRADSSATEGMKLRRFVPAGEGGGIVINLVCDASRGRAWFYPRDMTRINTTAGNRTFLRESRGTCVSIARIEFSQAGDAVFHDDLSSLVANVYQLQA